MAAYAGRHIDVDFGKRMFPASLRRPVTAAARIVQAAFCAFMVLIGAIYVFGDSGLYRLGGRFPHTGIPDWTVALAIPVCFALITLRTAIVVVRIARGGDLAAKGSSPPAPAPAPVAADAEASR
jgi:TRAP-type C4-dicarboxylate transport system permease small subunit